MNERTAVLGCLHSNLEALTAVLEDIDRRGIRRILCVGDVVGYAADPLACIDVARTRFAVTTMGFHDSALVHVRERYLGQHTAVAIKWTRRLMGDSHPEHASTEMAPRWEFLRRLPHRRESIDEETYRITSRWVRRGNERAIVNVGSVGQPGGEDPRACYVTVDGPVIEWHRVPYDIAAAQAKIKAAGLPDTCWTRLAYGR